MTQSATDPNNIIMVGVTSSQIEYDSSLSQVVYSDPRLNMTARSRASQNSLVLGKHNWTVSGDSYQCSDGKEYTLGMKLNSFMFRVFHSMFRVFHSMFRVCSEYVRGMSRVCLEYVQGIFRVCSEYGQRVFRVYWLIVKISCQDWLSKL